MNLFNQTIKIKLIYVLSIFIIAIISIIGINKYNIDSIKIGSPTYNEIINSKDLIADILPPPAYIIEARLVTYQLLDAKDFNETKIYINKLAQLEKDIQVSNNYWQQNLHNKLLMKQFIPVYETGIEYFDKVNKELLPLIKDNNKELAHKLIKGELESIYLKHRNYVDKLVKSSSSEAKKIEENSSKELYSTMLMTILFGLFLIILALFLSFLIINNIVTSLSQLQTGLMSFFSFLNKEKDYAELIEINSNDEFGQMATVINQNIAKTEKLIHQDNNLIEDVKEVITNVHNNILTVRIKNETGSKSLEELKIIINTLIDKLHDSDSVITETNNMLVQTNDQLSSNLQEFQTIFNLSKDGIAILDLTSKFLVFNDAYVELTGYTKEELLNRTCLEMTPESERDKSKIALKKVIEDGSIVNFEKPCIKKCGSIVYINMSIALMPDKNRVLVTAKDITLAKKFEQNSKLASMGEMLENIAHQWKQPLSGITSLSSGVLVRLDLNMPITQNDLVDNMNKILEYSNYMNQTINDFRNFLKEQKEKEIFNISNIIEQSLNIVQGDLIKSSIAIIKNLDNNLTFFGYKNELMQVIINILNNAKDAMVENDTEDKTIIINLFSKNDGVVITIEDNGKGIPKDIISKIFDSHFTTKNEKGTGIGLYMSKQIINNSFNGELSVENINDGAKFSISFL